MKNKSILFVTALALFIFPTINVAQTSDDFGERISVGFKIGPNLSNVYDTKGEQFKADPKFGLAAGGFISIPIGKFLGIQPEVLFSQKGFQGSGTILGNNYSFSKTSNYIDVPILLALKASENFTFLLGPQYSYLISQKYVFNSALINTTQEDQFKTDNVRKNTFCATGGADFTFDNIVVGARIGLDLFNNNGDGTTTTPQYKNLWYQLTMGYRF